MMARCCSGARLRQQRIAALLGGAGQGRSGVLVVQG